jgi:flagellar protein FliS
MIVVDVLFVSGTGILRTVTSWNKESQGEAQKVMWKNTYLETRILTASPLDLVNILYEHAIQCVQDARKHLATGDIAPRATAIGKAISTIGELRSSLDQTAGGEIAVNLDSLYEYMQKRLTDSNIRKEDQPLAEVESLLQGLAESWRNICESATGAACETEDAMSDARSESQGWNPAFTPHPEFERSGNCWSA